MEGGAEEAIAMLNYIASKGYRCYGCRTSFETGFRFGVSACVFLFYVVHAYTHNHAYKSHAIIPHNKS